MFRNMFPNGAPPEPRGPFSSMCLTLILFLPFVIETTLFIKLNRCGLSACACAFTAVDDDIFLTYWPRSSTEESRAYLLHSEPALTTNCRLYEGSCRDSGGSLSPVLASSG